MRQKIGKAVIEYNEDGSIKSASFKSELNISTDVLTEHIDALKDVKNEQQINDASQYLLSLMFSKITELELRDVDKFDIVNTVKCKLDGNRIQKCIIKYYLQSK